jgi:diguanylate cyclase (GGDEF)-like protein/PAS domain S-box-containing protein
MITCDMTEQRGVQEALDESERQLVVAQRIAHLGSFALDLLTGAMSWSQELYRVLGLDLGLEPSYDRIASLLHPDDRPALGLAWANATERGVSFELLFRIIRAGSEERWVRARAVPLTAGDSSPIKLVGTVMDVTDRVEADRVRRVAETRFEIGFELATVGAAITDLDGVPVRVNPAACSLLGRSEDLLVGRSWTAYTHPDDVSLGHAVRTRMGAGQDTYDDERRYVRPDGTVVWASSRVTLVRDEFGLPDYFFTQLQDISQRKEMEQQLAYLARHDSLTGLPNRALLTDHLVQGLAGARRCGSQIGVMFVDLAHVGVNDSSSHACTDDLLTSAADRIAGAIRPGDTLARLGGDEFVVVCDDVSAPEAEEIAERILEALSQSCVIGDQEISVRASVGIAVADPDATPESLLRDSATAMCRAKERGAGHVELFGEVKRFKAERRWPTASALDRALERHEFSVHYQPIVDLSTGALVSAEALLRWEHPERGLVSPDEFVPAAEETGRIVPIGAWVLEQACEQLVQWQRTEPSMSVAVNVSVCQMLGHDIAAMVADVLRRTAVRPADLCLEMTESVLMDDVDYFGGTLARLKALGVRLAIDDFGTGYSSLSYLKRFPVDAVKVDRAFVDGLGTDPHDSAIVAAIVAMADALGLEVTAEGVETRDQMVNLKSLRCQRAQGFYLGRPMPAVAMARFVTESPYWHVGRGPTPQL